jgi:hypothetical protein
MDVRIEYSCVESIGPRNFLVSNFQMGNLVDYLSTWKVNFLLFIVKLDAFFFGYAPRLSARTSIYVVGSLFLLRYFFA